MPPWLPLPLAVQVQRVVRIERKHRLPPVVDADVAESLDQIFDVDAVFLLLAEAQLQV